MNGKNYLTRKTNQNLPDNCVRWKMFHFEHRDFGEMGSEFVIKHDKLKRKRFCILFIIFTFLACIIMDKISEQKPFYLWMIAIFLALVLFYKLYTKVSAEIFLVLPSIGLQVQTKYLFGSISTQFMDISKIKDVIINEAISLQSVIFYLAVLLKEEKSENLQNIYPLFIHSWPNLCILKKIYSITQRKLIMTSPTAKLKQS